MFDKYYFDQAAFDHTAAPAAITPAPAVAIATAVNPTVLLVGSAMVSPSPSAAIATSIAPTVVCGAVIVTPSAAIATINNPTVIYGSLVLSPSSAAAIATVVNPTVACGSVIIIPSSAAAIATSVDPTVACGAVIVTPSAAIAIATVLNPTVSLGVITVTPSAAAAIATTGTFVIHAGDASPALLEAQKQAGNDALIKLELTHGEDSYTYTRSRILACDHWTEPYSHRASIVLDNSDGALGDIDLRGYQAVISYGAHISGGDEYAATAPLWVIDQGFDSAPGKLLCTLSAEGIPDRLARDRASAVYAPSASDTSTVKDLINAVLGATIACYSHAAAYDVLWDGEDDLIDSYQPKDSFRI